MIDLRRSETASKIGDHALVGDVIRSFGDAVVLDDGRKRHFITAAELETDGFTHLTSPVNWRVPVGGDLNPRLGDLRCHGSVAPWHHGKQRKYRLSRWPSGLMRG